MDVIVEAASIMVCSSGGTSRVSESRDNEEDDGMFT